MISNKELLEKAKDAMKYAYVPYSHFKVGAAVVTEDDLVYCGCNIENSSYGATNCAERTAIFKAVSEGHPRIKMIAIVSSANKKTPPCGICLQVMSEFVTNDAKIILQEENQVTEYKFVDFLPNAFCLSTFEQ